MRIKFRIYANQFPVFTEGKEVVIVPEMRGDIEIEIDAAEVTISHPLSSGDPMTVRKK